MKINIQKLMLEETASVFRPLVTVAPHPTNTIQLFKDLGWDVQTLLGGDVTPLTTLLTALVAPLDALQQLAATPAANSEASLSSFKTALLTTKTLSNAVQQLTTLSLAGGMSSQFYTDVVQKLFAAALFHRHQRVFYFFVLTGVIVPDTLTIKQSNHYVKFGSKIPLLSFSRLLNLLKQPSQQIADTYWPNGLATDLATPASTAVVGRKLFSRTSLLLNALGIPAAASLEVGPLPTPLSATDIDALKATMYLEQEFLMPSGSTQIGLSIGLLSVAEAGPGLFLGPRGAVNLATYLGNWLVELNLSTQLDVLAFRPSGVEVLGGAGNAGKVALQVSNVLDGEGILGNQTGTRLQLGKVQAGGRLDYTASSYTVDVFVSLAESVLSIHPDEGDSFLNKIIPTEGLNVKFNALLGWSSVRGLYFGGQAGLKNTSPVTGIQVAKFLKITSVTTELLLTDKLETRVSASGEVTLGPVTVSVDEVGLAIALAAAPNGGNAGPFDVTLGFKSPGGVGIKVASDTIAGGGYLYFDPANHRYAGVGQLKFKDKLNLNAVGILQTQLPNNQNGYSLILLITAQFNPIQLGLGFTLNGVGGIIGVNRHVDTTFLLGLVRNGGLDQLLFPANVLDNPMQALATVDNAFPVAEGQYVFGLMAKIGWGTPTLITLDVALLIELPNPVRLAIIGILRAILPDLDHPILRLRADFVGTIDFATQRIAFDASLHDSGILMFNLSGDMAFRLYQGSNPVFVLTAGGFHPYFQPPANANLPTLRRLTLALADGNDFRITLASYFAVTSNTVQFGSRLDLYVHLFSKCTLEGYLYFDALFQFNPFHVDVRMGGGVAIKWDGDEELSISLRLAVTGPSPWHVWGTAEFELFIISYTHDIDETFNGGAASQPALGDVNVRALLLGALADKGNWEMYVPGYREASPVVLRPAEDSINFLVDPSGILTFTQRLVPLGYSLGRYGNARPIQGNQFDILSVTLGTGAAAVTLGPISTASPYAGIVDTKDFFAPGQFRPMDDTQKLSSPSFQLMNNGIRLFGPEGYASGPAAVRGVEYELIIVTASAVGAGLNATQQRTASDDAANDAGTAETAKSAGPSRDDSAARLQLPSTSGLDLLSIAPRVTIAADTYRQLAKNSAVGRAYAQQAPSLRAPDQFVWQDEEYAVVYASNLAPYPGLGTYGSEAEATAFLRGQLHDDPYFASDLVVVPAYQLAL